MIPIAARCACAPHQRRRHRADDRKAVQELNRRTITPACREKRPSASVFRTPLVEGTGPCCFRPSAASSTVESSRTIAWTPKSRHACFRRHGSAKIDCALLIRGVEHEWHLREDLCPAWRQSPVTAAAGAPPSPPRRPRGPPRPAPARTPPAPCRGIRATRPRSARTGMCRSRTGRRDRRRVLTR